MDDKTGNQEWLAEQFERNRAHLKAVAYRMLGSPNEADDAVQEAWLRFSRSDTGEVENLGGWLTSVVARICLDMLRSRARLREEPMESYTNGPTDPTVIVLGSDSRADPEQEAVLADSVGLALLVVLETLSPAERLAFVLHDLFGVPFDEIASMVGRSPTAARQLATRARRRVRGVEAASRASADLAQHHKIIAAFFAAAREGNFEALLEVLDADVVVRTDFLPAARQPETARAGEAATGPAEVHGAQAVARQALTFSRFAQFVRPALINGIAGVVAQSEGRLYSVMAFTMREGKIAAIDVIAAPARLRRIERTLANG